MAVTYAWRLDANKYAYILGPNNEVGYVSASPIVGDALNTIAATANERFGEKVVDGFTKYKRVGVIKPIKNKIWDNRYLAEYEDENQNVGLNATEFEIVSGNDFYPGMLIREINN